MLFDRAERKCALYTELYVCQLEELLDFFPQGFFYITFSRHFYYKKDIHSKILNVVKYKLQQYTSSTKIITFNSYYLH